MPVTQPYYRTCRQFSDGHYAHDGKARYIADSRFAKDGEHYVRALTLLQKDLQELFDFVEPDDKNKDCYSYRIHELHMRAAIEVEANCKAILAENSYVKLDPKTGKPALKRNGDPADWNMGDFKKLERTHLLSNYEVRLPVWKGPNQVRQPFKGWVTDGALPWWDAYNAAKHDRHEKFAEANFTMLIDAICALVAVLSAQFHTHDFSPGAIFLSWGSGRPAGYKTAIGDYFLVKFPAWSAADQYDFKWDPAAPGTFQKLTF
jgi:hypothetical protein